MANSTDPIAQAIASLQQQIDAPRQANATVYAQRDSLMQQLNAVHQQIQQIEGPDIQKARRILQRIQHMQKNNE